MAEPYPWSPGPVVAPVPTTTNSAAVVKVLLAELVPGAMAGPEGFEPSAVGFGDRGATSARAFANGAMQCARA
jgi:hypothetical protein